MGTIEDVRKIVQDLVAPDLKAIQVKLEALAQRMDDRFAAVNQRFTDAENLAAERHNQILVEIRRSQDIDSLWKAVRNIQDRLEHRREIPGANEGFSQ